MPRNEIADARDLKLRIAKVLDEATVQILALTSSAEAVIRAAYEERQGIPAYDDAEGVAPRDVLKRCRYCERRFWARASYGPEKVYCSQACMNGQARRRRAEEVA